jgi:hypothetical protein
MNSMIIGIVLLTFFLFDHVQILKTNCHKREKMVLMKNLLELEVPLIFMQCQLFFLFLLTKRLGHIRFGGKSLNNLKDVISLVYEHERKLIA